MSAPRVERDPGDTTGAATPLGGLTVVDLSTTTAGAMATQFLADGGADVVVVEPPGGSPLRARAGWPALARGKRSVVLDLHDEADGETLRGLIRGADVAVTTFRPAAARRLGLSGGDLGALNPRLVSAAITGWGGTGPWKDLKGYEGVVMAKLGVFHVKQGLTHRPGPAFVSVPYATWGAAQTAVHGILTALIAREADGRGQHVEADLVRGLATLDTWAWFTDLIARRWPDAYPQVPAATAEGDPLSPLLYALMAAPTRDGHWLQFAQVEPRLFAALLEGLGLTPLLADPEWAGFPAFPTAEKRIGWWEIMLRKVGERTLAEWQEIFAASPNLNAEVFRTGPGALEHPQLAHDGRVVTVTDPGLGPVRQPSTLVHAGEQPLTPPRPAPRLDEHAAAVRAAASATPAPAPPPAASGGSGLPLEGVTVLELATMFAAPYGSTLLTDLGARVIKVEALTGDGIRTILPFPEAGGAKVLQGKESIAVDLAAADGLRIVHEIARRSDIVLQGFRAGAAERSRVDAATLQGINPGLVYVNAPGYGTSGPFGHRPAYAPSIGAAAGFALTDAPDAAHATGSLRDVRLAALRLSAASAVPTMQADGAAALGVASAMLLGLLARRRGRPLPPLTATMLGTATHALLDQVVDYAGRPASPTVDPGMYGFSALYRIYQAADGWVFLAAPAEKEWAALTGALKEFADLGADARFATAAARAEHDAELAEALTPIFAGRPRAEWEDRLTAADVACVEVAEVIPERLLQSDEAYAAGYCTDAVSPVFEEHRRLAPVVRFSRSATQAKGGCRLGQHTDAILAELGYDDAAITDLRARGVVGG